MRCSEPDDRLGVDTDGVLASSHRSAKQLSTRPDGNVMERVQGARAVVVGDDAGDEAPGVAVVDVVEDVVELVEVLVVVPDGTVVVVDDVVVDDVVVDDGETPLITPPKVVPELGPPKIDANERPAPSGSSR